MNDSLYRTCSGGFPPTVQRHENVAETLNCSRCMLCKCGCESVIVCRLISVTDPGCFPAFGPMKAGTTE